MNPLIKHVYYSFLWFLSEYVVKQMLWVIKSLSEYKFTISESKKKILSIRKVFADSTHMSMSTHTLIPYKYI